MAESRPIADVDEVSAESTVLVTVRDLDAAGEGAAEEREAILIRHDGEVAGWLNYCRHLTHIRLDKGSGAPVRDGEIICTNHGAMFDAATGRCTHGPCEGAVLESIEVAVEDGTVVLSDDRYEYLGSGPAADDDLDLTSTSNVEF